MFRWIENWVMTHAATPERLSERALGDVRLELFRAEQQVLDAQTRAAHYRARLAFFEDVADSGIERIVDQRLAQGEQQAQIRRATPKLASAQ